ncbi:MAG TPA: sugar transferase [Candidatus Limnocylindria bacterium]|nr:sugar transferase [Candidatus Limnocylindria bacterium]
MEQITQPRPSVRVASPSALLYRITKRAFDIVASAAGLVILSPLLLVVAAAIVIDDGLPVLYRCQRIGRFGRTITVLKFRTMRDGSHHHLQELLSVDEEKRLEYHRKRKLRDDPRRTRVGIFLRRTSLDELAQLINVLVGDMSIVGPRPYLPNELLHRAEGRQILRVRPGITGLWQVNGRSDRTFEERIAFDLEYVRKRGIRQDVSILARTIGAVLSGRGAY